jgi:hypothetical protein
MRRMEGFRAHISVVPYPRRSHDSSQSLLEECLVHSHQQTGSGLKGDKLKLGWRLLQGNNAM